MTTLARRPTPPPRVLPPLVGLGPVPAGCGLRVRRLADGALELSWPALGGRRLGGAVALGALLAPVGLGLVVLGWALRAARQRARLVLGHERLQFVRPGCALDRLEIDVARDDLEETRVASDGGLVVRAAGQERYWVGAGGLVHALGPAGLDYVHRALDAWRDAPRAVAVPGLALRSLRQA